MEEIISGCSFSGRRPKRRKGGMGRERNGQETEKKIRYANNIIKAIQEYPSSRLVGSQSLQQDSKPSLFFWPQCVSSFCNQEDYQCICWLASNHLDGWIQHSVVHSWSVDTDVFLTSLQNPNRLKFHSRSTPQKNSDSVTVVLIVNTSDI